MKKIVEDPSQMPEWMYTGMTYLIPKTDNPGLPSEYRPITCMTNHYKVVTKLVAQEMRDFVEVHQILSENQLGTVRNCQAAKEQASINKNLSLYHENNLATMWIDVKKAYDSVNHEYLIECLGRLNIPSWCIKFVKSLTDNWKINLNYNKKVIANIGLERGILQGDSLSPLLFVLCMEPLSRKLNISHETVPIEEGSDWLEPIT